MPKLSRPLIAVATLAVLVTSPVVAEEAAAPVEPSAPATTGGVWSADASIGMMNGQAREYVFDPGTGATVSRLDWDIDNVAMFNALVTLKPLSWLELTARGSTNLSSTSHMDDYDFDIPDCPDDGNGGTFCESNHSATRLVSAYAVDVSARIGALTAGDARISPIVGYKWDYMSWRAINGTSNYAGVFEDGVGISYEQTWKTPYVGLAFDSRVGKLGVSARGMYSDWAEGTDRDHHHSRSLLFREQFDDVRMLGFDIGLSYALSQRVALTAAYAYQDWRFSKGPVDIQDLASGDSEHISGDAAGASLHSETLSLGVSVDLSGPAGGDAASEPAPARGWTGAYAGAAAGLAWHQPDWTTTALGLGAYPVVTDTARASFDNDSAWGGLFAGYTWQLGRMVLGVEAEGGKSAGDSYSVGIPGTASLVALGGAPDSVTVEQGWDGSLRARAGALVSDNLLVYATGGLAFGEQVVRASCSETGPWCLAANYDADRSVATGWTAGGGLEFLFGNGTFARAEYRFTDLGSVTHRVFDGSGGDEVDATVETTSSRVNVGAGLRF